MESGLEHAMVLDTQMSLGNPRLGIVWGGAVVAGLLLRQGPLSGRTASGLRPAPAIDLLATESSAVSA
jgi:hypothetical protein